MGDHLEASLSGDYGASGFTIKDSGKRGEYAGGMVRDTEEGKLDWSNLRIGPMPRRIVAHLTKGREKYPDPFPGIPNWTQGRGIEVWLRARASFNRHNDAWQAGLTDEDHAAAMYFNMNLTEYVRQYFTPEEEAQAEAIEALQREKIVEDALLEDRKRKYLGDGIVPEAEVREKLALPETPIETARRASQTGPGGRALLDLKPESRCMGPDGMGCMIPHDCDGKCACAPWNQDDGTGLDENGDAVQHAPDCGRRDPHDFSGCSRD